MACGVSFYAAFTASPLPPLWHRTKHHTAAPLPAGVGTGDDVLHPRGERPGYQRTSGIANSEPARTPVGQRIETAFCLV